MNFSLKNLLSASSSTAEIVDGHLILSLPDAVEPKVWRMALDKIGTAAFEIKQESESDAAKLILSPKKGTVEIIANFASKKEAVEALMAASKALQASYTAPPAKELEKPRATKAIQETPQARIYKDVTHSTAETSSQKWVIVLLGALIVIGLYMYLTPLIPERVVGFETTTGATSSFNTTPQESTGVPVSADDFLSGR